MSVRSRARFDLGWILVILLTVFAVAPLTYPGFFQVQSGFLPAFNAAHLARAPDWGRVADPVLGEGKVPYLLAWPFFQLSGSGVAAIKCGYGLAFVLGALGIYAWTRRLLGPRGAVLASAVYTYLPWHLSTVYVRGAYAEAWLWAFWPCMLWSLDLCADRRFLLAAIAGLSALAVAVWTQPGLLILSVPLLTAYAVALTSRRRWPVLQLTGALLLPLLLIWYAAQRLPAAHIPIAGHWLYPFQLVSAAQGDGLSFQVGLAGVGLTIVAVALWTGGRSTRATASFEAPPEEATSPSRLGRAHWFWLMALLVLLLLTLPLSAFVWQLTGLDAFVTYPWQLLALSGLPLAFLAGSVARLDQRLATLPAWAGLLAFVVLASYPSLAPRFTQVDPGPEPVAMVQPLEASMPQILLLDYEIAPPTEITPTLTVTLTWQTVEPVAGDYTVFVHVLDQGDVKAAQRDSRPCDGECPTSTWQPGEIILDRHQLTLTPGAPPGPYRLALGLYLLDTGERAAVLGRDDGTVFLHVP